MRTITPSSPLCPHQNEYGLMVEDETGNTFVVTPESMSKLFKHSAKYIDCVILGACYSEAQASAISEHINYVIGISGQLDNISQINFSIGLEVEFTNNEYTIDENNNVIGLNLSSNQLSTLPRVIAKLKNLKKLVLTKNQFENFPLELLELNKLTVLRLGENLLTSLPNEVTNLKHLEHLSLNANLFKTLPIKINKFPNLQELDLRNNLLTELPNWITDLNIAIKWDEDGNHYGLYL